jgi:Mn-dependent DtxR family transcriptional regulator
MPKVRINERSFQAAQRRAADGGYANIEEYIADLIAQDVANEASGYEHVFTAELLARLDQISGKIKAGGKTFTMAEVRGLFENGKHEE